MTGSFRHRYGAFARVLGRLLVAALAVEGGVLSIALGYSCAICDGGSDKLFWGLMLAVFPLMSPYVLALWLAAVAFMTFALPELISNLGWPRALVCIGVAWVAIFGLACGLSAWLARPGCLMLI